MTQVDNGVTLVSAAPWSEEEFEAFYKGQFPMLARFLVYLGASVDEADDAAQKAMIDLYRRLKIGADTVVSPAAWVRRASYRYFVKERQRERSRLPHEIKSGQPWVLACADEDLTSWEDDQYIDQILGGLTPGQRAVVTLILDGMSIREISERLGKQEANVRQQLKNGRDRLKLHPEIAVRLRQASQGPVLRRARTLVEVPEVPGVPVSE